VGRRGGGRPAIPVGGSPIPFVGALGIGDSDGNGNGPPDPDCDSDSDCDIDIDCDDSIRNDPGLLDVDMSAGECIGDGLSLFPGPSSWLELLWEMPDDSSGIGIGIGDGIGSDSDTSWSGWSDFLHLDGKQPMADFRCY
jgi:hypothetical protein